jgi:hypothetical protein
MCSAAVRVLTCLLARQARTMADFPEAAHDLLLIDHLLSEEERATRHAVRAFAVSITGRPHWNHNVARCTVCAAFGASETVHCQDFVDMCWTCRRARARARMSPEQTRFSLHACL